MSNTKTINFLESLSYNTVQPSKYAYSDLSQVPDNVPYSDLDTVSTATIDSLPLEMQTLIGKEIPGKHSMTGGYEIITEYLIQRDNANPGHYLVTCSTGFQ